jgi:hypothetical protein
MSKKCQICVWTVPSRKKWKKQQINTHPSRISAKLGHPILKEEYIADTKGCYRLSVKTKIKVLLDSSNIIKKSISFAITISIER